MKRSVKALSAILILAALIGLAGGGLTLKDVMDCKGYWEAKGVESDANLAKLEDGLNTLKANEAAYLDGAFAEIATRHGSIGGYLEQALGVDAVLAERIRGRLTT